jgi:hypothetical protein
MGNDRARRQSAISIDIAEAEPFGRKQEPEMTEIDYSPQVDPLTDSSLEVLGDSKQLSSKELVNSFGSNTTATQVKDLVDQDWKEIAVLNHAPTYGQDSELSILPLDSETSVSKPDDDCQPPPPRVRTFGPPIHQDSGFHELSVMEAQALQSHALPVPICEIPESEEMVLGSPLSTAVP